MNKKCLLAVIPFLLASELSLASAIENAYDQNGKAIVVDTSSFYKDEVSKKIYSQDGSVYLLKGNYESSNDYGNITIKDCSEAMLFTDPDVVPDVAPGSLPGDGCYLQQINYDEDGTSYKTPKEETLKNKIVNKDISVSTLKTSKCTRFSGYAPPFAWSTPLPVVSHIGYTTYTITIEVKGDTSVNSWTRYWSKDERWQDRKFMGSTTISTGSAAASVYMTYLGIPFGSSIEGKAC